MARRGTHHHLWLAILLVAAGIGAAGIGLAGVGVGVAGAGATRDARPASGDGTATAVLVPTAFEDAVVPARTEAGTTAAGSRQTPGRTLLPLVAALAAGLAGLVGLRSGRASARHPGRRPLVARRYAIALRAPPSLPLA